VIALADSTGPGRLRRQIGERRDAVQPTPSQTGRAELRAANRANLGLFGFAFLFSMFVNALMLTGPLYMLQIYDRVLGSRSEETLLALSVLVVFLYGMMGILDYVRGRVMARAGARFQSRLDRRVFDAVLALSVRHPRGAAAARSGLRDLESVQRLFASPVLLALFDIPWTPLFLAVIFVFHPWLGWLAVAGGALLILITALNQWATMHPGTEASRASAEADRIVGQMHREAELVRSLGMQDAGFARWQAARGRSLHGTVATSDRSGLFTATTRTLRLMLQSAMLGLGAFLVLRGQITAGAMIAASIMLGRALAPIEAAIGQWQPVQAAMHGWSRLAGLLGETPPPAPRTELPRPRAILEARQLTVLPPGARQATLRMVSFRVEPGQALGVIGPSGAGKTTLARALTGVWPPAGGSLRLDGAALDQYPAAALGRHVGYLPQHVALFDGTIAENIARLSSAPDPRAVVRAAQQAAVHDMVVALPDGYDTPVSAHGGRLSGGQIQRLGLARALYGDPVIVVLDEPNASLDNEGSEALNAAIRALKADGRAAIVMAHRPAAIRECDLLLVLDGGTRRDFGPRDEVLRRSLRNHGEVRRGLGAAGASPADGSGG
jgi:ATP-binding cassette, subfamily C, bacterial